MGVALADVTHLHIDLPWSSGCINVSDIAEASFNLPGLTPMLLLPLALACLRLKELTVSGPVSPSLLSAFGSACQHLTTLRAALPALAPSTLKQLGTLLPHLTSLVVLGTDAAEVFPRHISSCVQQKQRVHACCCALHSCPKLLALDLPAYDLTKEVWDELPPGLLSCVGGRAVGGMGQNTKLPAAPIPSARAMQLHVGMRNLTLTECTVLHLHQLASFLVVAPNLLEFATAKDKVLRVLIDPAVHNTTALSAGGTHGVRLRHRPQGGGN